MLQTTLGPWVLSSNQFSKAPSCCTTCQTAGEGSCLRVYNQVEVLDLDRRVGPVCCNVSTPVSQHQRTRPCRLIRCSASTDQQAASMCTLPTGVFQSCAAASGMMDSGRRCCQPCPLTSSCSHSAFIGLQAEYVSTDFSGAPQCWCFILVGKFLESACEGHTSDAISQSHGSCPRRCHPSCAGPRWAGYSGAR
jgi:hypothetical protein